MEPIFKSDKISHEVYDDFGVCIQYVYNISNAYINEYNYWTDKPYAVNMGEDVKDVYGNVLGECSHQGGFAQGKDYPWLYVIGFRRNE